MEKVGRTKRPLFSFSLEIVSVQTRRVSLALKHRDSRFQRATLFRSIRRSTSNDVCARINETVSSVTIFFLHAYIQRFISICYRIPQRFFPFFRGFSPFVVCVQLDLCAVDQNVRQSPSRLGDTSDTSIRSLLYSKLLIVGNREILGHFGEVGSTTPTARNYLFVTIYLEHGINSSSRVRITIRKIWRYKGF